MKRLVLVILLAAAVSILQIGCHRDSSIDASIFSAEVVDGARVIHNHAPQRGDASPVKLELIGKIDKHSPDGKMIFSTDRSLPYKIKNEMKAVLFKSGNMEREFPWPSVTSVTKGIHLDQKNGIWVLTFLKQPNKFGGFDDEKDISRCYEFDVFDSQGIQLFKVPFPNIKFDNISVCDDRMYLIDSRNEACVYEYRIVEKA